MTPVHRNSLARPSRRIRQRPLMPASVRARLSDVTAAYSDAVTPQTIDAASLQQLRLHPITHADAPRIHEWASQERSCRYQPWGPNSVEETKAFVADAVDAWRDETLGRQVWVATLPDPGVVGLGEIKRRSATCVEIAYAVHTDYWGRGIGSDIARLLIANAFSDPNIERVQATCDPRNRASATVLARVGMRSEGTLRHTLRLRDGWRDSAMHSVLRQEWVGEVVLADRVMTR